MDGGEKRMVEGWRGGWWECGEEDGGGRVERRIVGVWRGGWWRKGGEEDGGR